MKAIKYSTRIIGCAASLLLLIAHATPSHCQISLGGSPLKSSSTIEWIDLPGVQVNDLLMEDARLTLSGMKTNRIAEEIRVYIDPGYHGLWEQLQDGTRIWRAGIRGPGAKAMGLVFSRYDLAEGVKIFIYDPSGENVLGAYSRANNKQTGELAVSYLPGDQLIVQMELSPDVKEFGSLSIGSVRWAYLPVFPDKTTENLTGGVSDACNIDINCPEGAEWQEIKHSVVRMIGLEKCTGVLVNNTANDSLAYVYTAAHCIFEHNKLQPVVFYFNYESPTCGGGDGSTAQSISGYTLLSTGDTLEDPRDQDSLDFALLELSVYPPAEFDAYFAGWNSSSIPAEHTTTLHHPGGDVMKISIDNDPPEVSYHDINYFKELVRYSHWRILEWDLGTTEAGSSGCPLFDQDQLVVGTLTGGQANCTFNIRTNDYFTRMDYAWDYYPEPWKQLKYWLDQGDTGLKSMSGRTNINAVQPRITRGPSPVLYPNPATDKLSISADLKPGLETRISIFNAEGRLVREYAASWTESMSIAVGDLPSGLYICRIGQEDRLLSGRFIISR